jgi:Pilus formation protein N terminal region
MSAVFGRRRRLIVALAGTLLSAAAIAAPAQADTITVNVDAAQTMKLPDKVATIVIGNPLIADATLQNGGILVITGKGFGSTNLLALDRAGRVVMDKTVQVLGPVGSGLVVVYKGTARESYSCTPECAPRITLGDDIKFFTDTLAQSGARTNSAAAPASK